MMLPLCDCGTCRKCKQRAYWRKWAAKHPDYRILHPDRRWGQGRVDPTLVRMDELASDPAWWARFAIPDYHSAAERFKGWGPTAGVMRMEAL